jgi:hypothetical protein
VPPCFSPPGIVFSLGGTGLLPLKALATTLQAQGAEAFVKSREDLMTVITSKCASLGKQVKEVSR